MNKDLIGFGPIVSAGLLFTSVWKEWNLPWPVVIFIAIVGLLCAIEEGGGKHPMHD